MSPQLWGLTAHRAHLQGQGSPFPWHICSSLLIVASMGMVILPVGRTEVLEIDRFTDVKVTKCLYQHNRIMWH